MFRRKTDQVYATLQQVQRRITAQTGNGGESLAEEVAVPTPAPLPQVPSDPLRVATALGQATQPLRDQGNTDSIGSPILKSLIPPRSFGPVPSPLSVGGQPVPRRPLLQLPYEAISVVLLLWLVTVISAFFIGRHFGQRSAALADPGAGYANGPAGNRSSPNGSASDRPASGRQTAVVSGRYVLVVASIASATPENETRLNNDRDRLNKFAEQNAQYGYKPWFGVRKPASGGLQLVFGMVDGRIGIDKEAFASFADSLTRAGYKDARWIPLDEK